MHTGIDDGSGSAPMDVAEFCRRVEDHLARVNDGHIVRVVGPGFELVRQWALAGMPLSVVCQGISRKAERHRAGRSTRPLRIEFCEADVRAEFQAWCRAVGVARPAEEAFPGAEADTSPAADRRRPSLSRHLGRAIDRLASAMGRIDLSDTTKDALAGVLETLAAVREQAATARGPARDAFGPQLQALDANLLAIGRQATAADVVAALERDATEELGVFRTRLSAGAWSETVRRATDRLIRERLGLPVLDPDV